MSAAESTISKQTFYLTIVVVFLAGFLSGVTFTIFKSGGQTSSVATAPQNQGMGQQESQAILNLEAEVTANPTNFSAWTQLGHLYFDTNQYDKAISAYTKSLELHSGNANLWTDLGVMYRRTDQPEKALESFDKAMQMDAQHTPSRFNTGIVLHFDLGRTTEALAMWESVLALDPNYQTANGLKLLDFINDLKAELQKQPAN